MTEGWDWELTERTENEFFCPRYCRAAATSEKLDEAVTDELREPPDYLSPLTALPYSSLRSGDYRAIIDIDRDAQLLWVMSVGHRDDVYENFP